MSKQMEPGNKENASKLLLQDVPTEDIMSELSSRFGVKVFMVGEGEPYAFRSYPKNNAIVHIVGDGPAEAIFFTPRIEPF